MRTTTYRYTDTETGEVTERTYVVKCEAAPKPAAGTVDHLLYTPQSFTFERTITR